MHTGLSIISPVQVHIEGEDLLIDNNFNLASPVINALINGHKEIFQVINLWVTSKCMQIIKNKFWRNYTKKYDSLFPEGARLFYPLFHLGYVSTSDTHTESVYIVVLADKPACGAHQDAVPWHDGE